MPGTLPNSQETTLLSPYYTASVGRTRDDLASAPRRGRPCRQIVLLDRGEAAEVVHRTISSLLLGRDRQIQFGAVAVLIPLRRTHQNGEEISGRNGHTGKAAPAAAVPEVLGAAVR